MIKKPLSLHLFKIICMYFFLIYHPLTVYQSFLLSTSSPTHISCVLDYSHHYHYGILVFWAFWLTSSVTRRLPWWLSGKKSTCQIRRHKRCGFNPWGLPEKFHGQRSLVGHHPWGCKELDTTEHVTERFWVMSSLKYFNYNNIQNFLIRKNYIVPGISWLSRFKET